MAYANGEGPGERAHPGMVKRTLWHMQMAKVQVSVHIRAV